MLEFLKKGLYTGLGLISMSKDAIEKAAKKLGEDMKLSEEEGKKLYDEMVEKSEETKKNLENEVEKIVTRVLDKLNLVRKEEIEELKKRISELEGTKVKPDEKKLEDKKDKNK